MVRRLLLVSCGLVAALVVVPSGCSVFGLRTTPEAPYTVVRSDGRVELRSYPTLVLVETTVPADVEEPDSVAFRKLYRYITGANSREEDIAMTAPVFQAGAGTRLPMTSPVLRESEGTGGYEMAFVLPEGLTLDDAPTPTDSDVRLVEQPARTVAALRYSGGLDPEGMEEAARDLESWLGAEGLSAVSAPRSAGYDPPWTIPFLRRNEILIDVE